MAEDTDGISGVPPDPPPTRPDHAETGRQAETGQEQQYIPPATVPPTRMRETGTHPDADRTGRHPDRRTDGRTDGYVDRPSVVEVQKERYGGIKAGSAFFGWLTATGMAVLLTALVAAAGTAVGVATNTDVTTATTSAVNNPKGVGLAGAIALLVIVLVSYYCGGYVAGRMARFNGARQGVAVWLWAVAIAVVLSVVALVAGSKYNVLAQLNAFPRIPVNEGTLTSTGIIALLVVAVAALVGAVLGGLAGMRYHRRVDRAGLENYGQA